MVVVFNQTASNYPDISSYVSLFIEDLSRRSINVMSKGSVRCDGFIYPFGISGLDSCF